MMDNYVPKFSEAYLAIHGSVPTAIVTDSEISLSVTTRLSHDDYPVLDGYNKWICLCYQCKQEFKAKRRDAKFCSVNCRKAASRRKDQIERARRNIEQEIQFIRRMSNDHPDLDIFASLELDKIRRLLNVPTAVVTDRPSGASVTTAVDTDNHTVKRDIRREDR